MSQRESSSPTPPRRKKLTPKQRVLKRWREARCVYDPLERDYIITTDGVIARAGGKSPRQAWRDAAGFLYGE